MILWNGEYAIPQKLSPVVLASIDIWISIKYLDIWYPLVISLVVKNSEVFFLILFLLHLLASFHSSIEKCYDSLLPTFYTPPPIFSSKLHSDPAFRSRIRKLPVYNKHWWPDAPFLVSASLSEIITILNLTPQMSFAICKHHNGIIPHVLLVSALLCSALYLWGLFCVVACDSSWCTLIASSYSLTIPQFVHFTIDGYLNCFHFGAVMNRALWTFLYMSWWTCLLGVFVGVGICRSES